MTQLWLNGERVDSLAKLRQAFKKSGVDQVFLCAEMFRRLRDDILLKWLDRQEECRRNICMELCLNDDEKILRGIQESLVSDDVSERIRLMSDLCGVSREVAEEGEAAFCREKSANRESLMARQPWYVGNGKVKRLFRAIQWDAVVDSQTNPQMLNDLLRRFGERPGLPGTRQRMTVYLCDIVSDVPYHQAFMINDLAWMYDLRIVGFGEVNLQLNPTLRGELDVKRRNIMFVGMARANVHCQNVTLLNWQQEDF